jgi:hypothetical protein
MNSQRDPIRSHARKTLAARRVGENARCSCGESRPHALIANRTPAICASCERREQGKSAIDRHHPAGRANSGITIPVPVNDHRAVLSVAQYDWPSQTLENPTGNQLLKAAARFRGFIDSHDYLMGLLRPLPELLEEFVEKEQREKRDE